MDTYHLSTYILGPVNTNCYLISCHTTGEAYIIDPADSADFLLREIRYRNCSNVHILLTHGHFDHIGAARDIQRALQSDIYIHPLDSHLLLGKVPGMPRVPAPDHHHCMYPSQSWSCAGKKISYIHTPGHTPGSICILFDNLLFSGDTLFENSIGRTDLPGASLTALQASLSDILLLDDRTIVYPGHGASTTLLHERRHNPYLSPN